MYVALIQGLSYFGTDFKMISYLFPSLTQKHIKLKFRSEELKHEAKITHALRERRKAPPEIRARMLQGVQAKREVEDARYVNRKADETVTPTHSAEATPVKVDATLDANFQGTPAFLAQEAQAAQDEEVQQEAETHTEAEQIEEQSKIEPDIPTPTKAHNPSIELPDLSKHQIKKPKVVRRKKQQ
jgi:hypothetical protein